MPLQIIVSFDQFKLTHTVNKNILEINLSK